MTAYVNPKFNNLCPLSWRDTRALSGDHNGDLSRRARLEGG